MADITVTTFCLNINHFVPAMEIYEKGMGGMGGVGGDEKDSKVCRNEGSGWGAASTWKGGLGKVRKCRDEDSGMGQPAI